MFTIAAAAASLAQSIFDHVLVLFFVSISLCGSLLVIELVIPLSMIELSGHGR